MKHAILTGIALLTLISCSGKTNVKSKQEYKINDTENPKPNTDKNKKNAVVFKEFTDRPMSDQKKVEGWQLNTNLSDEFNGSTLDKTKWWILGENGDYRSKWKGRAPGQFAPQNVKVQNGKLILSSRWEPGFNFTKDTYMYNEQAYKYENITQAAIVSEHFFKYGYMEIKCKAANAPVTSSFWTTGYHSEIDMTENYGKRPIGNTQNKPEELERKYRTNIINWDPDKAKTQKEWKNEEVLNKRIADDYHVYGCEWNKDYIKLYFDGKLLKTAKRSELETKDQWRLYYAQELWLDSEVFSWYGLPTMADLANNAGDYKIDYVRIWQKKIEGPYFDALGFEGPFYFKGHSANWWAPASSVWRIKRDKVANGELALRFKQNKKITTPQNIFSPYGSLNLPKGNYELSFKIWIDKGAKINEVSFVLNNPWMKLNFDLSNIKKGKWVTLSQKFNHKEISNTDLESGDRIYIQVNANNIEGDNNLFYIDDVRFDNNNNISNKF